MSLSGTAPTSKQGQSESLDGPSVGRPLQQSFRILPATRPAIRSSIPRRSIVPVFWNLWSEWPQTESLTSRSICTTTAKANRTLLIG